MSLEFSLNCDAPTTAAFDCVIVGVFADPSLPPSATAIDAVSGGRLTALISRGDVSGKLGKVTLLHDLPGVAAPRVLTVGLGQSTEFGPAAYLKAIGEAISVLRDTPIETAYLTLSELVLPDRSNEWPIRQAVIAADHAAYRYTGTPRATEDDSPIPSLKHIALAGTDTKALEQGQAIAAGIRVSRDLGNLPPNICTPVFLAEQAWEIASEHEGAGIDILDDNHMRVLGMNALLAVAQGSVNRPRLIILKWEGASNPNHEDIRPYVLVGKGITFDTGGVNLKVQGGIEEMKYDMCGGAAVIGAFTAAVKMRLPINVIAIVPAVENAIGGNAYRPSDILVSMSGKTIEVGNTDAEGRLILCDALTYAQRFNPQALVDVATLTGACMVALGRVAAGLMSPYDDLADELLIAGYDTYDRAWRLPLWDDYQSLLDSTFADVYNIGGRWGGAITAGCFLSRFAEGQRWAHLDIAGVANTEGKRGMATGRPVNLLAQWLMDCCS